MATVNELVHDLIAGSGTSTPVRLAESDREDDADVVRFSVQTGTRDPLLAGSVSGFESWAYTVAVCGNDGAAVETDARVIRDYLDALAINYSTITPWVVQSCYTSDTSDDNRPEIVGDKFQYSHVFTLYLCLGRSS